MDYERTFLSQDLVIDSVITIHYFEYTNNFFFPGEVHNFWELLYVDKGEVEVTAGNSCYTLKKGDIIFHKPMEFHNLSANGVIAPNLVVIAFDSKSTPMEYFNDRILKLGDIERDILANIISHAKEAFSSPLDDPQLKRMELKKETRFGSQQLIKMYLEMLLINIIRNKDNANNFIKPTSSIKEKNDQEIFNKVILYLEENLHNKINLDELCRTNQVGYSYLQKLFKRKTDGGVMNYFAKIKIQRAKQYIRENTYNFNEIAHKLGYSSAHYFSRQFKKIAGMTPTEYATSVKLRSEMTSGNS